MVDEPARRRGKREQAYLRRILLRKRDRRENLSDQRQNVQRRLIGQRYADHRRNAVEPYPERRVIRPFVVAALVERQAAADAVGNSRGKSGNF